MGIDDLRVALSDIENTMLRKSESKSLTDKDLLNVLKNLNQDDVLASVRDGDKIVVFHAGERKYVEDMLDGYKAVQNDYSGYIHRGLFVAPTFLSANRFMEAHEDGITIAFLADAKDLHGANWDGRIDSDFEQGYDGHEENWEDQFKKYYPDSEKPYLSYTMLSEEPKGMFVGEINPNDIIAIMERDGTKILKRFPGAKQMAKKRPKRVVRKALDVPGDKLTLGINKVNRKYVNIWTPEEEYGK